MGLWFHSVRVHDGREKAWWQEQLRAHIINHKQDTPHTGNHTIDSLKPQRPPSSTPVTPLSTRLHLISPQQFHQVRIKHSSIWVYQGHFISKYHNTSMHTNIIGLSDRPKPGHILMIYYVLPSVKWNMGGTNLQKVGLMLHMEERQSKIIIVWRQELCIFSLCLRKSYLQQKICN